MEATAYQKLRDSLLRLYLDDPRSWLVATTRFDDAGDAAYLLNRMEGRQVQLPGKRDYWPDKTHLAWHRPSRFADSRTITMKDAWAEIEARK